MVQISDFSVSSQQLDELCQRFGVKELALFGSRARGDHHRDSDLDVLVDFLPETRIGLMRLSSMLRELQQLFNHPVDLVPKNGLKPRVRNTVLSEAIPFYHANGRESVA